MRNLDNVSFPSTYLLWSIANRNLGIGIVCGEIVDNAFGAAAGDAKSVWIDFLTDRVIFTDNGVGMRDITKLFELGGHLHDEDKTEFDIGKFGEGAKDALLSLGWHVRVQTVRDGIYHQHEVDWFAAAKAASPYAWPLRYSGKGMPAKKAPLQIQDGGTRITVTKLREGRRPPTIDAIRNSLARSFKPALRQGRKIFITANGRSAVLDAPESVRMDDRIEATGNVNGMRFDVVAGALLEHSPVHNKIFYGFGHRILGTGGETKLCGETIPPLFTCEVQLSGAWKEHLQTNKIGLAAYHEELQEAVFELVKPIWDTTKTVHEEARIDWINAKLANATAKILAFRPKGNTHNKSTAKSGRPPGDSVATPSQPKPANPDPKPNADRHRSADAIPGSEGAAKPKRNPPTGIRYRKLDNMDEKFALTVFCDHSGLEVRLNGKLAPINNAYAKPFKVEALWPVIAYGITAYLLTDPDELRKQVPNYETLLEVSGWDDDTLEIKLFTHCMKCQPMGDEAKSYEPKAADVS